ncbi:MAG: DUF2911 domain-containing protein [Vicinamibacterales bacterium]|jgi:hypothetical protein|nr:DUF2911 domain-containing protein [Vicinamibacterales bacterium]
MKTSRFFWAATAVLAAGLTLDAQQPTPRRLSPPGTAATQVGGQWVKGERGERYQDGKWIEVTYNRPLLRTRPNIFGSGEDYGKRVTGNAPVWRVGADQSTRFMTEAPLKFGESVLPAGEYSMFVDLKASGWTLIFSTWGAQQKYDPNDKTALWGAYNYTADKDVLRVPMQVSSIPMSIDQLSIGFVDMTANGGKLAIWWDTTQAIVPFTVAGS